MNHPVRAFSRRSRGQSTVEFMIYVGLAALVLGGIAYFVLVGRTGTKTNDAASNLTSMTSKAQALYNKVATGYAGVDAKTLIQAGVVPPAMASGTTSIINQFGGTVAVAPVSLFGTNDGLQFTYTGVPTNACTDFVTNIAPWFAKITVGASVVKDSTAGTTFSPVTLATGCSGTNASIILVATR